MHTRPLQVNDVQMFYMMTPPSSPIRSTPKLQSLRDAPHSAAPDPLGRYHSPFLSPATKQQPQDSGWLRRRCSSELKERKVEPPLGSLCSRAAGKAHRVCCWIGFGAGGRREDGRGGGGGLKSRGQVDYDLSVMLKSIPPPPPPPLATCRAPEAAQKEPLCLLMQMPFCCQIIPYKQTGSLNPSALLCASGPSTQQEHRGAGPRKKWETSG